MRRGRDLRRGLFLFWFQKTHPSAENAEEWGTLGISIDSRMDANLEHRA